MHALEEKLSKLIRKISPLNAMREKVKDIITRH